MHQAPRVIAVHDLSGFGRCALSVASPVLSSLGVQCCPIPTAYLTTHSGGFPGYQVFSLTEQMRAALSHWHRLGLRFDGIYTGFLASPEQISPILSASETLLSPGGLFVVDPVMGDHGKRYSSCSEELCLSMADLCARAQVITPNFTEAGFLLGFDGGGSPPEGTDSLDLACALSDHGRRSVVLTGIPDGPDRLGAACFDHRTGRADLVTAPRIPAEFPGTGDLFASVLTGSLLQGNSLSDSAGLAARFVSACTARTLKLGLPAREGVEFEPLLSLLREEKGLSPEGKHATLSEECL